MSKVTKAPKYDPNIPYIWEPVDEFVLDGNEFGLLFQLLKAQSHTNSDLTPKQKVDAFNILEGVLKIAVESGIAKPLPQPVNDVEGPILPLDLPKL